MFFLPIYSGSGTGIQVVLKQTSISATPTQDGLKIWPVILNALDILIMSQVVVAIVLFRTRKTQLKFAYYCLILSVIYIALIYFAIQAVGTFVPGISGSYGPGAFIPVLSPVFLFLAARGISRDIKLVKSADRFAIGILPYLIKNIYLWLLLAISIILAILPVYSGSFYCEGAAIPQNITLIFFRVHYSLGYIQGIGQLQYLAMINGILNLCILTGTLILLIFPTNAGKKRLLLIIALIISTIYAFVPFYFFWFGIHDDFCKVRGHIHTVAFLSMVSPFLLFFYGLSEVKLKKEPTK